MNVFVINFGSSSLKFQLYKMPEEILLASGIVERNGNGNSRMECSFETGKVEKELEGFSAQNGLSQILTELTNSKNKCLKSFNEIDVVGHRLIHGGKEKRSCVEVTGSLLEYMNSCISLAPLHYPPNIEGIKAIGKCMPHVLQTGVFDTAFHHSLPPKAYLYGIALKWYRQYQIRKYGFHGTSHKYVANRVCELTGLPLSKSRIVSCHLGNGASVTAIKDGKSVDTSMGMTPVEGLLMGTRSGDIDAGVLLYMQEQLNLSVEDVQHQVNKEGGLLGLSGVSADYRDVFHAAQQGDIDARAALEVYYYRIKKYIGAYAAAMGGLDAVAFTGGVGENSSETRWEVCKQLRFLGIHLSQKRNKMLNGKEAEINTVQSEVKVFIVPANEELMIAREAFDFAKRKRQHRNS